MPPLTKADGTDVGAIRDELARTVPTTELVEVGYLEGTPLALR
jgi:hypothetical protein